MKMLDDKMRKALSSGAGKALSARLEWLTDLLEKVPYSIVSLLGRLLVAGVFWNSARTKVDGWNIFDVNFGTRILFEQEFGLPYFMAVAASVGEHVLAIMLVLGLGTRLAALGLIVMTIVIQIVQPGGFWDHHIWWFVVLLMLATRGGGRVSLDKVVVDRWVRFSGLF